MVEKKEPEDVELEEDVGVLKWIGPYLSDRLGEFNIITCEDLLEYFVFLCEEWEGLPQDRREFVKGWLEDAVENDHSEQCIDPKGMDRDGEHYGYKVRFANKMGFNTIVKFWTYHAPHRLRTYIPTPKRGRTSLLRTYPQSCRQ